MPTKVSKKQFFAAILICLYLLLLIPNSIVASVDKESIVVNGKVISAQTVPYASFPKGIRDVLPEKPDYNVVLIKDLESPEKTAIIYRGELFSPNDYVKVEDITTNMYTDPHVLPFVDEPFNTLIIGKADKVKAGAGIIDLLTSKNLIFLVAISKIFFLVGGLLIILALSYIFSGTSIEMWILPGILSTYSFQFFIINILTILNRDYVIAERYTPSLTEILVVPFSYLFIFSIPLTFYIKKHETTEKGEILISKANQFQLRLMKPIISMFSKYFG
ncbi:Uncharacterised protein [uncultured archaeon]|nr:Uncharacterised protein [uncultured archaeon]